MEALNRTHLILILFIIGVFITTWSSKSSRIRPSGFKKPNEEYMKSINDLTTHDNNLDSAPDYAPDYGIQPNYLKSASNEKKDKRKEKKWPSSMVEKLVNQGLIDEDKVKNVLRVAYGLMAKANRDMHEAGFDNEKDFFRLLCEMDLTSKKGTRELCKPNQRRVKTKKSTNTEYSPKNYFGDDRGIM